MSLVLILSLFGQLCLAETVEKEFTDKNIKELDFQGQSGDLKIKVGNSFKVNAAKSDFHSDCKLQIEEKGTKLIVHVEGSKMKSCGVNFKIAIPDQTEIDAKLGAGDIYLEKLAGDIDIKLGAGDIKIEDSMSKKLEVKIGSGDLNIHYSNSKPKDQKGELDLKVGAGDIKIEMPKDFKVNADIKNGWGKVKNDFTSSSDKSDKSDKVGIMDIEIKSGAGDVVIKQY